MSFSSNLATWLGSAPNALQSGRVDCYVGANNDKTGYSLTAGSYSVRGSSTQLANGAFSSNNQVNSTISSVTTTRAVLTINGNAPVAATAVADSLSIAQITTATNVQHDRGGSTSTATSLAYVLELF